VAHVLVLLELEVVKGFFKQPAHGPGRVLLESDEGSPAAIRDRLKILQAQVRLIRAHFANGEGLPRFLDERNELRGVGRVLVQNPNRRDDVRFHTTRDMHLDPHAFHLRDAVLLIEPSFVSAASEPARINRELRFNGLERRGAFGNQRLQDRRKGRVFHERRRLDAGNLFRRVAALVRFAQIGRKPPAAERAVDLEHGREDRILECVRLLAPRDGPFRFRKALAQVERQFLQPILFDALGFVVGGPVLLVGNLLREGDALGLGYRAVRVVLALGRELDRVKVLALVACFRVVRSGAGLLDWVHAIDALRPRLRRDKPTVAGVFQLADCRNH
jgi:hypothetical protein